MSKNSLPEVKGLSRGKTGLWSGSRPWFVHGHI